MNKNTENNQNDLPFGVNMRNWKGHYVEKCTLPCVSTSHVIEGNGTQTIADKSLETLFNF